MPSLFNNQYKNLASKGRYGDTMLAHINPQEAALLKARGGSGTVNPQTGLPEFFDVNFLKQFLPEPEPLPVLAQVFQPNEVKEVASELQKITVPQQGFGLGTRSAYETIDPELNQYADKQYGGMGAVKVTGYTVPTDLKFQGKPLEAKYDPNGNFVNMQLAGGDVLIPDPNQPNIAASPKFNKSGGIVDYGVFDVTKQSGGGFGDFVSGLVSDFGPMLAVGLGANALLGSGLLGAGGATAADIAASNALAQANLTGYAGTAFSAIPTGTGLLSTAVGTGGVPLGPYVSQAAGAYGGSTAAANAAAAGNLTGITNAALAQNTLTADALARTGLTYGGNLTPASIPTTGPTPTQYPTPSPTTGSGSGSPMAGVTPSVVSSAGSSITPSMLQSISDATGISVDTLKTFGPSVIQGLVSATGSYLTSEQAKTAAQTQADAQIRAAQIAADAARFRPVGVTTRFGTSNFTTDAQGNVIGAGYTPSAEILGYQNRLSTLANQGLTDAEQARTAYAPLTGAAQNLFSLGQSYLAKTPEQAAQDYIAKQTALLAPSRENQLAQLQNKLFQQGRIGSATAQGGNLMATNPEMAAYYNSLAQSDLALAAQADQEARNRITYGVGLFDTGAGLQGKYYAGQTAALAPFTNPMDVTSGLEQLAQVPMNLGTSIGQKVSTANANVGSLTGQGIINAAGTMAPANAYSLGGNLLSGAASSPVLSSAVNKAFGNTQPTQQQYTFNPQTGQYVPVSQSVWI